MLYNCYHGLNLNGVLFIREKETTVKCYCLYLPKLNLSVAYLSVKTNLQVMGNDALCNISRIQYGPTLLPYGICTEKNKLEYIFRVSSYTTRWINNETIKKIKLSKKFVNWFNGTEEPPRTKISARHLRHITIHELRRFGLEYFINKCPEVVYCLSKLADIDLHESMLAGVLVWAILLPEDQKRWSEVSGIWHDKYVNVMDFAAKIKNNFSLRLKALQNLVVLDLTPFFELEVLVNRGVGGIDWNQEKINRTKPELAKVDQAQMYEIIKQLFKTLRGMGGRPEIYTWENFWNDRWRWAPTGAYHSQYEEDLSVVPDDPGLKNKFFCLNATKNKGFNYYYNRTPETVAWSSKKYEWGKERAIYGVDITNFIMSSFAMSGCEQVLEKLFPIGATAEANQVKKTVGETLKNGIPFCFDFEDFNSQHSFESMDTVLKAYKDIFADKLNGEQVAAINWLRKANTQTTILNDVTGPYKTNGTLLSGWRLTTFMNTVLNYAYTKMCMRGQVLVSTHNGDDILAAVTNLQQVQILMTGAYKQNIRFQKTKCFLGSVAEFLRVDHRTGTGSQYLARAVSTFVHGPTESVLPNNLYEILNSMHTRKKELEERKANKSVVEALFELQLQYTARKWKVEKAMLDKVLQTHISRGGISDIIAKPTLEYDVRLVRLKNYIKGVDQDDPVQMRAYEASIEERLNGFRKQIQPGVLAYTNRVVSKFGLEAYHDRIKNAAEQAILSRAVINRFTIETISDSCDQVNLLRASQYGMFRNKLVGAKVTIAKTYKIPIFSVQAENTNITDLIMGASDPILAMSLWL
uniref:RNA-directed RNA polymerase n=1 Tax=Uromyces fabae virus TaxID=3069272 RepID=A0AA51YE54_9VIRU|nr:putative RNA-dependent RNA polymerase [Uromyces fabae virus]